MFSQCLLLLQLTLLCHDTVAYLSYNPRYIDLFTSLESELRSKRSGVSRKSQADELYLQSLFAPFLPRRTRAKPAETNTCPERSGLKYNGPHKATLDVRFPSIHTTKDDEYLCTAFQIPFPRKESFIVKFTPHADMEQTHHMLVFGCGALSSNKPYWRCYEPCANKRTLYAWARNAPELTLPKDVGYSIGGDSGIQYIVVQMHFAKTFDGGSCAGVSAEITTMPQKYYAGIFLMGSPSIYLPPHSTNVPASAVCSSELSNKMHVFAFRTHAHTLANVITGYRLRDKNFHMIGKGNPKWPQSFYPRVGGEITLNPDDVIVARCLYNNTRDHPVLAGPSGSDEMCNLYMMFYTDDKSVLKEDLECWGLPGNMKESDIKLPADVVDMPPYPGYAGEDSINAIKEGRAKVPPIPKEHIHHMHGHGGGDDDNDDDEMDGETEGQGREGGVDVEKGDANSDETLSRTHGMTGNEAGGDELGHDTALDEAASRSHGMPESEGLKADLDWPHLGPGYEIGAVGGLVADPDGNLHVFHRAGRLWTKTSFDTSNRFTEQNNPIKKDTVYHISKDKGKILHAWGKGQFFMPHGISLDDHGNMWLTDVALHQVLKYPPGGADEPLLTLGERFVPGTDIYHFCKPTDVAVDEEGMVYVADGYCNGRVMKFAPDGSFITQWGRMVGGMELLRRSTVTPPPGAFFVAHNIILCGPERQEVCVADRENGRIQCFNRTGGITRIIEDQEKTGYRIFAIAYSPLEGGVIYGVNGPDNAGITVGGFTLQYETGEFLERWEPSSDALLTDPHDITASPSGENVYVGDLTNKKVYKFDDIPSAMPASSEVKEKKTGVAMDVKPSTVDESVQTPDDHNSELNVDLKKEKKTQDADPPGGDLSKGVVDKKDELSPDGTAATVVIVILIVLPTVAILTAFACIRIRARRLREYEGLLSSNGKTRNKLNLGKFLKRSPDQKGYSGVPADDEDDENSDSDVEVYSKNEKEDETGKE